MNRLPDFGEFPVVPPTPADEFVEPTTTSRLSALLGGEPDTEVTFKNVDVIESADDSPLAGGALSSTSPLEGEVGETQSSREGGGLFNPPHAGTFGSADLPLKGGGEEFQTSTTKPTVLTPAAITELWDQEFRSARRKLEPEGALTGATRELQAALGTFLTTCHEHGVKVGPWRLQHVVPEWPFGEHPTYGVVSLAHWACKDGQPWKVGVGLFLARGAGKPKDLEIKLGVMDAQPPVVDHLILLRPEDDLNLTGKSKTLWADAEKRGKHARLEPASLDGFAVLYSFPRWLSALREALPAGAPLPNLADVIQDKAEKLLEQVCMPIH